MSDPIRLPDDDVTSSTSNAAAALEDDSITISLMREPYKSIMHAHFRLLGDKFQGGNEVEKLVAERVLRLLKRRGNRGCSDAANDVSEVKLYKLVRYGKGAVELVDDEWAFSSEFKLCCCL